MELMQWIGDDFEVVVYVMSWVVLEIEWIICFVEDLLLLVCLDLGWLLECGLVDMLWFVVDVVSDVYVVGLDYQWVFDLFFELVVILGDVVWLYQVVINLLVNVCVYIGFGMIVMMCLSIGLMYVVLQVIDNGLGILVVLQFEVFEWFVCGDMLWFC